MLSFWSKTEQLSHEEEGFWTGISKFPLTQITCSEKIGNKPFGFQHQLERDIFRIFETVSVRHAQSNAALSQVGVKSESPDSTEAHISHGIICAMFVRCA